MAYGSVWGMKARIPALSQVTSQQINDYLLAQTTFALDAALGQCFGVPFSSNNVTVNGFLIYDLAEVRARDVERDEKTGVALRTRVNSMLGALRDGHMAMMQASSITAATGSADTLFYGPYTKLIASPDIVSPWMGFSATRTGPAVFDMDDWINQQVDPALITAQREARGFMTGVSSGM
jgi:hypothetical protein